MHVYDLVEVTISRQGILVTRYFLTTSDYSSVEMRREELQGRNCSARLGSIQVWPEEVVQEYQEMSTTQR